MILCLIALCYAAPRGLPSAFPNARRINFNFARPARTQLRNADCNTALKDAETTPDKRIEDDDLSHQLLLKLPEQPPHLPDDLQLMWGQSRLLLPKSQANQEPSVSIPEQLAELREQIVGHPEQLAELREQIAGHPEQLTELHGPLVSSPERQYRYPANLVEHEGGIESEKGSAHDQNDMDEVLKDHQEQPSPPIKVSSSSSRDLLSRVSATTEDQSRGMEKRGWKASRRSWRWGKYRRPRVFKWGKRGL